MRRFAAGIGLAMGLRWLFRRFRGTPAVEPLAAADPAEELKRKLAESRSPEPEAPASEPAAALDDRRRAVHDRARAAIDEMRGKPDDG